MKTLYISFLLLLTFSLTQAQWSWQNPLPQGNDLTSVNFIDANIGWAVGDLGAIIRTTDGGTNWISQSIGTYNRLLSVYFVDANNGTAVGTSGTILRTTNGGYTWVTQVSGTNENLTSVSFSDINNGIAIGFHYGTILKTTDGGATWVQQSSGVNDSLNAVSCYANTATAVGEAGLIIRTTNGGTTWVKQSNGISNILMGVCFKDANTGTVVGTDGTILRTINGGLTWVQQSSGTSADLYCVSFSDFSNGTIVGSGPTILRTTNGGITWVKQTIITSVFLAGVSFTDANNGTVVGSGGTILRTTNAGLTWIQQSRGTLRNLTSVSFTDANNGTAVGSGGTIIRTTNAGQTWIQQSSGTTYDLDGVTFTNVNNGTAVGTWGTILRTTNGGVTWIQQPSGTSNDLNDVAFIDVNVGTVVGNSGIILRTSNGGSTWIQQSSGTSSDLYDVTFTNYNNGTAVGKSRTILMTTNGGITWIRQTINNTSNDTETEPEVIRPITISTNWEQQLDDTLGYYSVSSTDVNHVTVVGAAGTILRTTNGGSTWVQQYVTGSGLLDVYFIDNNNGTIVGVDGTILKTINGGNTWTSQYSGIGYSLNGVSFIDANTGWAVGGNGTILDYDGSILASLSISAPIGGENWQVDGTYDITWSSTNVNNVKIEYTADNGVSWLPPIIPSTPSDGSYSWTIPNTPSTQCKVKITDVDNPSVSDESDGVFTISAPILPRIRMRIVANGLQEPEFVRLCVSDLVGFPVWNRTKPVSGGFVEFDQADLQIISEIGTPGWKFDRAELRSSSSLIGHISFIYTREDFQNNKQVDAILYLHSYPTNLDNYPGWDYYSSINEKMVSMLIPPLESFDAINYNRSLLLLVHGVDGEYPYWGSSFVNGLSNTYDSWQLYYPYNQEIGSSGLLLHNALNVLLYTGPFSNGTYSGRARIVAHSMGGLVTRSYIQNTYYNNGIHKLVMIGTPNYGSYSVYRLRNEPSSIAALLATKLGGKDEDSPAYKQMIPGSEFIYNLNLSPPKQPDPPLSIDRSYLVIAGTSDGAWDNIHTEIQDQEDGVVAVSSASLLNYGIPLATVNLAHTKFPLRSDTEINLTNGVSPLVITEFLAPSYDPINPTNDFLNGIDGWWNPNLIKLPTIGPIDATRGIILLKIPGLEIGDNEYIEIEKKNNTLELQVTDKFNLEGSKVFHRGEDEYNYFSEYKPFSSTNEIGLGFPESIYNLKFQFRFLSSLRRTWGSAVVIPNAISFKHLQSTMGIVYLSSATLTVLNAKSRIQLTPIALNLGEADQYFILNRRSINNKMVQLTSEYLVDSSIDSVTFILNGAEGAGGFENHSLHLVSPTGQLIDSIYAQSDPNIDFSQDNLNGIAYYFVRNPEQGIWQVTYNDTIADALLSAPIATDFNLNVRFSDSLHSFGEAVNLEIPLPQPIDYTNIQITGNIFRLINGTDTLILVSTVDFTFDPGGQKYTAQYVPTIAGYYYIGINFNCNRSGELITRNLLEPFNVSSIAPPQLVLPLDNQNLTSESVQFYWNSSMNANEYRLQIVSLIDSLPILDQGGITDTSFTFILPNNQERFFWKVEAINGTDSSTWSEFRSFTRITTILSLAVSVTEGWNMVSVPGVNPGGQGVSTWWPNRNTLADVYRWTTTYDPVTLTAPREGYWMLHTGAQTYNYPAIQIVAHDPIALTAGWNMIGGYENTPLVSGLTTTPANLIVTGTVYGWTGTYSNATNLVPGFGYWVLSNGNGVINSPTVADGPAKIVAQDDKSEWGKITITDASGKSYTLYSVNGEVNLDQYQMPPLPPAGMFDVRYGSNRKAENLKENNQTIEMRGLVYPVTVRAEKMDLKLQDETGKVINVNLKAGEDLVISDATIQKLKVSGESIPTVYALEQNYPNPFNPSTKIEFSIPEDVNNVTLTIYNTLGQKVAELVNSKMEAGKYSYVWNASDVATGLYIYELRTDKFVSVKKMILLK